MTGQTVLDIFEPPPLSMVPMCGLCGAEGEPVPVEADRWNAAALWCLLAISEHEREQHPEVARV